MGSTVPEVIARAKQLIAERKHQEAVRACRRVLLARPDEAQVRLLLGQALLALNRSDEVRLEMLSLVRKNPENASAHRLLGEARMRLGRSDEARKSLKQALKLDPADDEARELLEELGESPDELPPPMETIDRWFADEKTEDGADSGLAPLEGEATTASVALPEESFDDPTDDPRVHTGPSIQVDPDLAKESRELELPSDAPKVPRPIPSPDAALPSPSAPPPPSVPKVPAMPRAAAPVPNPGLPAPPKASAPRAPAPSAPRAPRPKRKATLLGIAAMAPAPGAPIPAPGSSGPRSNPPPPPTGPAPTAGFDTGAKEPGAPLEPQTAELSLDDLAPVSGTGELDPSDLQPLAGEDTSQLDLAELDAMTTDGGLPGVSIEAASPDFNDETTRGARKPGKTPAVPVVSAPEIARGGPVAPPGRSFQDEASIDGTTQHQPRVDGFDFPSDVIDTGLPPLEGEATAAREAPIPEPIAPPPAMPSGFAPAALPGGPALEATATPMPMPSRSIPTERPPPPVADPIGPPTDTSGAAGKGFDFADTWSSIKDTVSGWRTKIESAVTERTGTDEVPTRVWVALAGIPVLLLVMIVALVRVLGSSGAEDDAQIAARTAADDGLIASVQSALAFEAEEELDSPTARARQAWLNAVAAYEHGADTEAAAESALSQLAMEDSGKALARIARTYLALERGAVEEAAALSDTLQATDVAGEGAYAKASVAMERGDTTQAIEHARRSQTARPGSARYAALLARVMAAQGESDPALQLTSGVAGAEASPVVRLARVEAHAANDDWAASLAEAEAVLDALQSRASDRQRAWAHLGAARALAGQGEDARAREELAAATEHRPPASESYGLGLAEIFLEIGSAQDARTFIDTLPEEVANTHRRAAVSAEVYLAQDDLDALEGVLENAADSPRTAFLRGRLAEAKEDLEAAKRFYEAASADDESRPEALMHLGAIALEQERLPDAIDRLEGAVEAAPANAPAVAMLARAHLQNEDADEALEVIERGLRASPDDPGILVARAEVQLAADQPEAAMRTLESLVEQRPNDADLHSSLGEAARRMGNLERAAQAYDRALELRPSDDTALLGKVLLAVANQDVEGAKAAVEAAEAGGVRGRELRVAKARLLVLEGGGRAAVRALQPLTRGRVRDADLLAAYGWAQAQAEDYRDAKRTFARALRVDEASIEAHLGMALVETRLGDLRGAAQAVGEAERIVRSEELGDRYEARVAVARGRVRFEYGSFSEAKEHAEQAVEKDARSAEAHFLLAMIADATGGDPEPHLRRASEGRMPPPEVFGQLVIHMRAGSERCELGERYLAAAPRGIDARDVQRLTSRCR
ncbi:MAG: tetratricopeptide repeat protein [Deltaproteobacteria bacterium]|nr:tetratricopeptide repeat protein [Deltaproteobacteria bacterium]